MEKEGCFNDTTDRTVYASSSTKSVYNSWNFEEYYLYLKPIKLDRTLLTF